MNPADSDRANAGLAVGQTYADPMSGIAITLTAQQTNAADIHVEFGGASCRDGVQNGSEVGVDCGDVCGTCSVGKSCVLSSDCASLACSNGTCVNSNGGWRGQYFSGVNFDTLELTRTDPIVGFNWGYSSPGYPVPEDEFSVRWTGTLTPPTSELYTFFADMDDGVRVWINDQQIINRWSYDPTPAQGQIQLTAGTQYQIKIDFFESGGPGQAYLFWSTPTRPRDIVSPLFVTPPGQSCTVETATDLGGPSGSQVSVKSNACVKITQFPDWWKWTSRIATLQASGNTSYPLGLNWRDSCSGATGTAAIPGAYQSATVGAHDQGCAALIQLGGDGSSNVNLRWY